MRVSGGRQDDNLNSNPNTPFGQSTNLPVVGREISKVAILLSFYLAYEHERKKA